MNLLAIDTATPIGSIALLQEETVVREERLELQITHAEKLLPGIARLLKEAGWSFANIQGLALTIGPGSFTGLRIGLATMKGFAQARALPLVGVSSLEALAYNANDSTKPVAAILDARRGEVYAAIFQFWSIVGARVAPSNSKAVGASPSRPFGAVSKILLEEQAIKNELLPNILKKYDAVVVEGNQRPIEAHWVGRLALSRLKRGEGREWQRLTPNYLRSSDAEVAVHDSPGLSK